jgi:hypothetical protein
LTVQLRCLSCLKCHLSDTFGKRVFPDGVAVRLQNRPHDRPGFWVPE